MWPGVRVPARPPSTGGSGPARVLLAMATAINRSALACRGPAASAGAARRPRRRGTGRGSTARAAAAARARRRRGAGRRGRAERHEQAELRLVVLGEGPDQVQPALDEQLQVVEHLDRPAEVLPGPLQVLAEAGLGGLELAAGLVDLLEPGRREGQRLGDLAADPVDLPATARRRPGRRRPAAAAGGRCCPGRSSGPSRRAGRRSRSGRRTGPGRSGAERLLPPPKAPALKPTQSSGSSGRAISSLSWIRARSISAVRASSSGRRCRATASSCSRS